ncbi:MAG TPA: thioredoxin family protein [Usitatibacter sp.]|jgi:thioredoxin-related protein
MGAAGRHPHFVSPLFWHASLAEGLGAARESKRALLLVVGRQSCGGSRALVEKTTAKEEIYEYLDSHYVCVAGDADSPEPAVAALVARMSQHDRTPLCLYLSAEGELMHSTSGGRPPAVFLSDLLEAPHRPSAGRR